VSEKCRHPYTKKESATKRNFEGGQNQRKLGYPAGYLLQQELLLPRTKNPNKRSSLTV
jgi:hypothetical protein